MAAIQKGRALQSRRCSGGQIFWRARVQHVLLPRAIRSSTTLAGLTEDDYTQEMLPGLGPIQDAEALGVGRGCPISDGRLCRTLRAGDPGTVLVRIKSAGHI